MSLGGKLGRVAELRPGVRLVLSSSSSPDALFAVDELAVFCGPSTTGLASNITTDRVTTMRCDTSWYSTEGLPRNAIHFMEVYPPNGINGPQTSSHFSATVALVYLHTLLVLSRTHNHFLRKGWLCTNIWHTMPQKLLPTARSAGLRTTLLLLYHAFHRRPPDLRTPPRVPVVPTSTKGLI